MTNKRSILVIFGEKLPKKSQKWWRQFERVIGPKSLEEKIQRLEVFFIDIGTLINPGSLRKAHELIGRVSQITFPDGSRVSKLINYNGYELWWMNYDSIYTDFCLPYTQYDNLLSYLKDFDRIYLYQSPRSHLFQYFLKAHNCSCFIIRRFQLKNLLPIPLGVFIQIILSFGFLIWLKITRPSIMIRTSDRFKPSSYDFDFRQKFIYEELRKNNLPFVEFIRSMESWPTVLRHAWHRKRPVIYSAAIIDIIYSLASHLNGHKNKGWDISSLPVTDAGNRFWLMVATHYLHNIKGTIWTLRAMKFILQWLGIKTAIIIAGDSRSSHETLGCKLAGIKTTGILHGAGNRNYDVYDFIPEFDGELPLSVDRYGLWSDWWRDYYISHSRVFKPEQLYVSGPMRPLEREIVFKNPSFPLKVLFISEDLADPQEIMPYFSALLEVKDFDLYFKFRPCQDSFELQLKKNYPEVYEEILKKTKIFRGTMEEAILQCDVAVGSYSTAVLEAFMQLKPAIFFSTGKWEDNFQMKSLDIQGCFFAENPEGLINCIRKSVDITKEDLKKMQERFFGNPYQNGSKWVVEQVIKFLKDDK